MLSTDATCRTHNPFTSSLFQPLLEDANTNTRQANECSARPSSSYPCHNILDKNSLRQKEGGMKSWELQADETNQFSHFAVCGKCLFFTLHSSSCRLFCIPANTQKEEKNSSSFPRLEFLNVILPKCRHVSVMSTRLCCLLIKRRFSFLWVAYTQFFTATSLTGVWNEFLSSPP